MGTVATAAAPLIVRRSWSRRTLLANLLFAHLILVTFQFVLRSTIFDTTFYRDVILIGVLALWFGFFLLEIDSRAATFRVCALDILILAFVAYGLLVSIVSMAKGLPARQSVLQFRNQFVPVCLYFAARYALKSLEVQSRFVRLAFAITLVLCIDVIVEQFFSLLSLAGKWLPWYAYFFRNSDRFVGNAVTGTGYVDPAQSPVLGVLGWPHYTAPTLVALLALVYPFLSARFPALPGARRRRLGLREASEWTRRIMVSLALISVLILYVRTHLISIAVILLVVPLMFDRTVLRRNLLLLLLAVFASVWVGPIRQRLIASYRAGFVGDADRPPVAELIFTSAEIRYFAGLPIEQKLLGIGDVLSSEFAAVGLFEVRIIFFTVAYGVLWFALFVSIYAVSSWYSIHLVRHGSDRFVRTFALGTLGLLAVYFIDMVHYARLMYFPNLDFWAVCLACLANLRSSNAAERLPVRWRSWR